MKKVIFCIFIFTLASFKSLCQGIDNDNFVVTHGPWIQNPGTTTITILWTTNKPAVPGITLTMPDGSKRFIRNSHDGIIDAGGTLHKVKIDGLQPGTEYKYSLSSVQILKYQAYRIYYGDTINSKPVSFRTIPDNSPAVSFTVFNDVHEQAGKMGSYLRHNALAGQDFYLFNGDMMDWLQDPEELYAAFLDTAAVYFAGSKPFFYVRGNHETRGFAARELKKWFDYREDRFYYSFDFGPVHFIILDGGEDKPDNSRYYYGLADYDAYRLKELEWLRDEVRRDNFRNAKFRIVIVHMPIVKAANQNQAMTFMSEKFGPVLKESGINLVLSAHTHKNTFYDKDKTGFGYPLLVNSNNSFLEVSAGMQVIKAVVKDVEGKSVAEYIFK